MTTNFALSLSFDGIRLFQRVPDGWHIVGETALDVPDLNAALAQLHAQAMRLDPSDMQVKLLIPNEQIKYVTLETAMTDLDDVMAALENATPYAIDELVVDFDRNGGRTYIAAVARETLQEAEAFAADHGFTPAAFAAVADAMTFKSEVFFGAASGAKSAQAITRDAHPFTQTGVAVIPVDPDAAPVFTPRPRMADPASIAPVSPPEPEASADAPPPEASQDDVLLTPRAPVAQPTIAPVDVGEAPKLSIDAPPVAAPAPVVAPPIPETAPPPIQADDLAEQGGFATRRKPVAPVVPAPDGEQQAPTPQSRKQKKAADFATKQAQPVRGKPRFLGLILTAILVLFMALVAFWASTLSEEDAAYWFGFSTESVLETAEIPPPEIIPITPVIQETALVAPAVVEPVAAALPQLREDVAGQVLSPAQAARIYAATGVWQRAPRLPLEPRSDTLDARLPQLTSTALPPILPAMPLIANLSPDLTILTPINPLAPGTDFDRDENGLVRATPEGALTPQGILVFAGPPPRKPPLRPAFAALPLPDTAIAPDAADATAAAVALAGLRPQLRPEGLAPTADTVVALADPALASKRPRIRPADLVAAIVAAAPEPAATDITEVMAAIAEAVPESLLVTPSAQAVVVSSRPDTRPRNFALVVARARDLEARQTASTTVTQPDASVSNAPARSSGNTANSVAQAATLENAIRLRDVNLIGVYGRPNNRRALVRLRNGRYVKVEIGSSLDGGRVTAIGDSALNYVKRGRTIALELPSG
ncbi:MAG: hypothetical protein ACI82I_001829 [Gammaproteobacteria bacterium]|jgi:hypothetical protein